MNRAISAGVFTFDCRALYRIRVGGMLAENWSDRLGGMVITYGTSDEGRPVSNLMGELSDQASLVGILNTLYNLHYPVLLVERL
jgi:hypothetical protein